MQIVCVRSGIKKGHQHKQRDYATTERERAWEGEGRKREERCQAGQMHAVLGGCCLLLRPLPSLIVIAILHTFAARKFPHFPTQFFLLDFCLATFFHIIKADYLGRRIVQRVLFVSMHVRKCTGQWTLPAPPSASPSPSLSVCPLQLHSWCAAALLILFQLCACECFVSLMGTFHFDHCVRRRPVYTYTHTHTTHTHTHI